MSFEVRRRTYDHVQYCTKCYTVKNSFNAIGVLHIYWWCNFRKYWGTRNWYVVGCSRVLRQLSLDGTVFQIRWIPLCDHWWNRWSVKRMLTFRLKRLSVPDSVIWQRFFCWCICTWWYIRFDVRCVEFSLESQAQNLLHSRSYILCVWNNGIIHSFLCCYFPGVCPVSVVVIHFRWFNLKIQFFGISALCSILMN